MKFWTQLMLLGLISIGWEQYVLGKNLPPSGEEIMKKVELQRSPETSFSRVIMTIKKGSSEVEKVFTLTAMKIKEDESHSLLEFEKPDRTKILSYIRKSGEDDRWIKTSSGKPKRIAASAENKAFAQSHFSYADLQRKSLDQASHELICASTDSCTTTYQNAPYYRVKSIPKSPVADDSAYVIAYVRVQDHFVGKLEYYDVQGKLTKELLLDDAKDIKGYLTPMTLTMRIPENGDATILKVQDIELDKLGIKKSIFNKDQL